MPIFEVSRMEDFDFTDLSDMLLETFGDACTRALVRCGQQAEGYAKDLSPVPVTGNLRNSISHRVKPIEKAVYIGTNCEYAPYIEFGTGHHSTIGGGTPKKHWAYLGDDGEWHFAKPMKPQPFLKPAITKHVQTYKNIIKDEMENS